MTSSSYENLLVDNDICFNYPMSLKLQSPLQPTSTIGEKSNGSLCNIEKFIDDKYAKLTTAKIPSKPTVDSVKDNLKQHFLDPISLFNQIKDSLKDQIETLKNEIHFLRDELREKNSLIKHLVGHLPTNSTNTKSIKSILIELQRNKVDIDNEILNKNKSFEILSDNRQSNDSDMKSKIFSDNFDKKNICINSISNDINHSVLVNTTVHHGNQISSSMSPFIPPSYKTIDNSNITVRNRLKVNSFTNVASNYNKPDNQRNGKDGYKKGNDENINVNNTSSKSIPNDKISNNICNNDTLMNSDTPVDNIDIDDNHTKYVRNKQEKDEVNDVEKIKKSDTTNLRDKKSIYIITDSMIKELRGYKLSKSIRHKKAVKIRSRSSATVSCLNDHVKPVLRSDDTEHTIIHIGTNELSSDKTPVQICRDIINLAYVVRDINLQVSISSLIQRNDGLNEKVLLVNEVLAKTCETIGMNLITHKNIRADIHLNASKIHLRVCEFQI